MIKGRTIKIGTRDLSSIDADQLLALAMIEGRTPALEYWSTPNILRFDNSMFGDTCWIECQSKRLANNPPEGKEGAIFCFYFNHKELRTHHTREDREERPNGSRIEIASWQYLIDQGFNIPLK